MAIVTNTFLSYSSIGNREDLSNVIYNISPEQTPFISSIGKENVSNTLYEWQTDSLADSTSGNAVVQGDDVTSFDAVSVTVRLGNRTQISRKTVIIADTLEAVDRAGRKSELAYQLAKKGSELKRDMETTLLDNTGAVTGDSTTAPKTASITAFIKTNVDKANDGGNPTYTSGVPGAARTDGTVRTFTETILKSVLQKCWTAGAEPSMVMVGPVNKQRASAFSGIATQYNPLSGGKKGTIVAAADVYVGDFGTVNIVPNRFMRERDALVIDPQYAKLCTLRPFQQVELAKTGDAEKRMIIVEYGLKINTEAAHGLAADLITS